MDEKLLNRIIAVAYGDASWYEKFKVNRLAKKREDVQLFLEEYTQIANKIKTLRSETIPEEIIFKVKQNINLQKEPPKSILFDLYSMIFGKPVFSGIIVSIIILAIASALIIKRPEIHNIYTQQEIQLADQQVKQSLALIAGVFNKTKSTVENDVLTNRISKPLKNSITKVNEFFIGDKNEKLN